MIYPSNFEHKIGFDDVRNQLRGHCLSTLGREKVDELAFSTTLDEVREWLEQVREFRRLQETADDFPLQYFFDVRESVARIRLAGTHMEEQEVFDLRRSLDTIHRIVAYLNRGDDDTFDYPALHRLADGVATFPAMIRRIDSILDKFGKIKDGASMNLASIRHDLKKTEGSISRTLYSILHAAQREGLVDKDATPTLRDGRLMIPVAPNVKRRINGIVHDESATGKTVFMEPAEVVEANNRIRELEAEERREVIRILTVFSDEVRPHVKEILDSYQFLAQIDLIRAKAEFAAVIKAIEPTLVSTPHIDWIQATHPLLALSLGKQGKKVVPLDIVLDKNARLLVISGPNAGGKSVCLKTVGLLQYMLQCGLSVPMSERSTCGLFDDLMIDIGDEQSIEDDLSTYSSHLMNMKQMMRRANSHALLLIDEFGGGTEPTIGGAIAEAVLKQFWKKETFGVITTHYQNLKHFADDHEGVVNGAMLYDRHQMQALFQLSIGQPGSSFAIEIARKSGIPEEVIQDASDIVGSEYVQSDKYLQDIVRDKRYWEGKRQTIHQHEKSLEQRITRYDTNLEEIERERKAILNRARQQAEELLAEANRRIENTIREIREAQAEKEQTRIAREELNLFREEVKDDSQQGLMSEEEFAKKLRQMEERKARKEKRKREKEERLSRNEERGTREERGERREEREMKKEELAPGATVRIKGTTSVGEIESIDGKTATIIFGGIRTRVKTVQLEPAEKPKKQMTAQQTVIQRIAPSATTHVTRSTIEDHKHNYHQDLDVRGMRGDDAVNTVMHFIDDSILIGMSRVRILHGTGNGILRQLIRQYLGTVPNVSRFRDEHVQFGGAGITVVDLD